MAGSRSLEPVKDATAEERQLKVYFEQEMRALIQHSASEPDGFRAYFSTREPRDEEILGLLVISAMSPKFPLQHRFPTPLEALAALSAPSRARICDEFRKKFRRSLGGSTAA